MTSETPENPIQISDHIKATLCLENFKENYSRWKKEICDVLRGHGLLRHVLDSNTRHSPYLADGTTSAEFERWKTQDQLIWYWMCSFVPPDIRTNLGLLAYDSSHLLWKNLQSMYTSTSFPSVPQLELRLQTIKKGDATCAKYLAQIQQIADCLKSLGSEMSEQDLVRYTLLGLGQEFNHFEWPVKLQHLTMKQLEKHLLSVHMAHYCSTAPTNPTSILNTDTDQAHLENVAGLGAEDSDIARSLPQDTSCLPLQITDPAAGGQVSMPLSPFERQVLDSTDRINLTSILNTGTDQAQYAPLSQPPIVRHPGQTSSLITGRAQYAPLSQPPIVRHPGQYSSLITGRAQYAPLSQPPIVCHPGQNSSLIAGRAQYVPLSQPLTVRHPGQYSSMLPGRAQYAPLSQPLIIRHPGQYSSLFAGLGVVDSDIARSLSQGTSCLPLQIWDPAAGGQLSSFERQVLDSTDHINLTSILNTDTDQTHLENVAGLGAEDSDIARSLPQDTSCLPLQTRDPAAGGQVVIISDDEEDAN